MRRTIETSRSFSEHLFKSFWASYGHIMTFIGLLLALFAIYTIPDETMSLKWFAIPLVLGLYLIFWFLYAAWTAFDLQPVLVPHIKSAKPAPKAFSSAIALLLAEPSVLYSHDAVVSVYFVEDDFERLIGVGRVYNVQDNKIIQVLVTQDVDFGDAWTSIINNDITKISKLRIKPTLPSFVMKGEIHE